MAEGGKGWMDDGSTSEGQIKRATGMIPHARMGSQSISITKVSAGGCYAAFSSMTYIDIQPVAGTDTT